MSIRRVTETLNIDGAALTANEAGATIEILHQDKWSAQVVWTSTTASATVQIQESNDGSTWSTISGKTQAISNDSGNVMLSGSSQATKYIRANLAYSSGTVTTLQVRVVVKD